MTKDVNGVLKKYTLKAQMMIFFSILMIVGTTLFGCSVYMYVVHLLENKLLGVELESIQKSLRFWLSMNVLVSTIFIVFVVNFLSTQLAKGIQIIGQKFVGLGQGDYTELSNTYMNSKEMADIKKEINTYIARTQEVDTLKKENTAILNEQAQTLQDTYRIIEGLGQEMNKFLQDVHSKSKDQTILTSQSNDSLNEMDMSLQKMVLQLGELQKITNINLEESQTSIETLNAVEKQMDNIKTSITQSSISVNGLSTQISHINDILLLIKKISSQTNLLSLNAAIEAARAGKSGKGFSIVADEIRKLSSDTDSAVSEIEKLLGDINLATDETLQMMEKSVEETELGHSKVAQVNLVIEKNSQNAHKIEEQLSIMEQSSEEVKAEAEEVLEVVRKIADFASVIANDVEDGKKENDEIYNTLSNMHDTVSRIQQVSNSL